MKLFLLKIATIFGIVAFQLYGLNGTVHEESFTGPITGNKILFNIYLPPGYENSMERYPVIYHLHGLNGNQGGKQNTIIPETFEAATGQNSIGPVIVVFPNGFINSMWSDSKDSIKPAETHVIREMIPYIDMQYRTHAFRSARAIEGFSMGGFGAIEYAAKFPKLFSSCVVYDGALHTWATLVNQKPEIANEIFDNNEEYFKNFSPWYNLELNKHTLIDSMHVRLAVGALKLANRRMRDTLQSYGITVEHVETICAHNLVCLLEEEGGNNVSFISKYLDYSNTAVKTDCAISSISGPLVSAQLKSGVVHITIHGISGIKNIKIYDAQGKVLSRVRTLENHIRITGSRKPANGVYFVHLVQDGLNYYESIIIWN